MHRAEAVRQNWGKHLESRYALKLQQRGKNSRVNE